LEKPRLESARPPNGTNRGLEVFNRADGRQALEAVVPKVGDEVATRLCHRPRARQPPGIAIDSRIDDSPVKVVDHQHNR